MNTDVFTLITILVALVGAVGGIIARDRYIGKAISTGDRDLSNAMNTKFDTTHERINKIRDEFVRREDLEQHMARVDRGLREIHDGQEKTNQRIDTVLQVLANGKHTSNS